MTSASRTTTDGDVQTLASVHSLPHFRRELLTWYRAHHRPLPWRRTQDAYAIWVSEIMLQQTQVATVIDYYTRFLRRFPNVRSLAEAPEQEVLTQWSGLGYYRRARQMHAAAQQIVGQHAGHFPQSIDGLLSLPGIGRYTAGAIASFAYGIRAPILEANTVRFFSRLIGLREDPKTATSQSQLWSFAERILPKAGEQVGLVNQAVMELGSLICTPKQPECAACPVQRFCVAHRAGIQTEIPLRAARPIFTPLHHALVVVQRSGKTLMRQNPADGWWAGLWDFPRIDLTELGWHAEFERISHKPSRQIDLVRSGMRQRLGLELREAKTEYLKSMRHGVTRYRIALHCYRAQVKTAAQLASTHNWNWVDLELEPDLPLTSTAHKLRRWMIGQSNARMP